MCARSGRVPVRLLLCIALGSTTVRYIAGLQTPARNREFSLKSPLGIQVVSERTEVPTCESWEHTCATIDKPLSNASLAGPVIGGIIAAIIILCLIGAGVAMYRKRSQSTANGEPPKHKPPPPMKSGSSTEMLNKPQDKATTITETQPLSNYMTNYYETNSAEPVTDLDDDNMGPPANGGTPNVWDGSGHPPEKESSTDETLPPYEPADHNIEASHANIAREESFMSQPMLV